MLVKIITVVDNDKLLAALEEISIISWETIVDERARDIFTTSRSISLRTHKITGAPPKTIDESSRILDCTDIVVNKQKYVQCYN